LLNRDLRFQQIAAIDSLALATQFLVTLGLAITRHDVWAIVYGNLAAALLSGFLNVALSGWTPSRPRFVEEAKAIFAFGFNTSIYSLSVFVSTNIASVLIGRALGPLSLGQYNRANALLTLPMSNAVEPIAQVALPVLARLRPTPILYRISYLDLVRKLNLIVLPVSVLLTFIAPALVATILGAKWIVAGRLLQLLSPAVAALGFGYAVGDLFITQNRSAALRSIGLAEMCARVAAVSVGVRFGVLGAALAYSISTLLIVSVRVYVAGRTGPISAKDHLQAAAPALPLAFGTGIGCAAGMLLTERFHLGALPEVLTTCCLGGALGCLAAAAFKESRYALLDVAATLQIPGASQLLEKHPYAFKTEKFATPSALERRG
jgi:PST family polysaccharide transporter